MCSLLVRRGYENGARPRPAQIGKPGRSIGDAAHSKDGRRQARAGEQDGLTGTLELARFPVRQVDGEQTAVRQNNGRARAGR